MTNREWLTTLTDRELGEFLCSSEFRGIKMNYAMSSLGVAEWLGYEHTPIETFENILNYLRKEVNE